MTNTITKSALRLAHTKVIKGIKLGRESYELMGEGLKLIRDDELYLETHETFSDFVADRYEMSKSSAYRAIKFYEQKKRVLSINVSRARDTFTENLKENHATEVSKVPQDRLEEFCKVVGKEVDKIGKMTVEVLAAVRESLMPKKSTKGGGGKPSSNGKPATVDPEDESQAEDEATASIVYDALDREVPVKLRESQSQSAAINSVANRLDPLKREILEIASRPGGEWLEKQSLEKLFKELKARIAQSAYWTDCPNCGGKSRACKRCNGRRFIPKRHKGVLSDKEKGWLGI